MSSLFRSVDLNIQQLYYWCSLQYIVPVASCHERLHILLRAWPWYRVGCDSVFCTCIRASEHYPKMLLNSSINCIYYGHYRMHMWANWNYALFVAPILLQNSRRFITVISTYVIVKKSPVAFAPGARLFLKQPRTYSTKLTATEAVLFSKLTLYIIAIKLC